MSQVEIFREIPADVVSTAPLHPPAPAARPMDILFSLNGGYVGARVLQIATRLGIADLLDSHPRDATELADKLGVDSSALYRLLRTLTAFGVFSETPDRRFTLNATAEPLRADAADSVRDFILSCASDWQFQVWTHAMYSARTGKPAFERVFGKPLFEHLQSHPSDGAAFDQGLACLNRLFGPELLRTYEFGRHSRFVDVGGGSGMLLASILESNPAASGTLVETPAVLERARALLESHGLLARCELVAGTFFGKLPAGADAYVLKNVIHDWPDESAVAILRNCREAAGDAGRILIIEAILETDRRGDYARIMDFNMMVCAGGAERTEEEFRELCAAAGLRICTIGRGTLFNVIEAARR